MKIKCEFCGGFISDTDEKCPNCGAPNSHLVRAAEGIPRTVEELKAFCEKRNMPLERMRFFIGEDFREPRAFGIYLDENGDFIVYKNKADGTRAIRYRGKDEAYAVSELYQKLKSEVQLRKEKNARQQSGTSPTPPPRKPAGCLGCLSYGGCLSRTTLIVIIAVLGIMLLSMFISAFTPSRGYYNYGGDYYYYQNNKWYYYSYALNEWEYMDSVDSALSSNYDDYYAGSAYDSDSGVDAFSTSDYYEEPSSWGNSRSSSWDDDWDSSDWDTDYGNWDSSDTDWNSDW